jgi:hypothetical protein
MTEEQRIFVRRVAWAILPGVLSGLVTAGAAWGTITVQLDWLRDDVADIKREQRRQGEEIQENGEAINRIEYQIRQGRN